MLGEQVTVFHRFSLHQQLVHRVRIPGESFFDQSEEFLLSHTGWSTEFLLSRSTDSFRYEFTTGIL